MSARSQALGHVKHSGNSMCVLQQMQVKHQTLLKKQRKNRPNWKENTFLSLQREKTCCQFIVQQSSGEERLHNKGRSWEIVPAH